jgi:AraC-like DNA-binding protein
MTGPRSATSSRAAATGLVEKPAPGALDPANWLPGAVPADYHFGADPSRLANPAVVSYDQFRSADADTVRRFFSGAYTPGWKLAGLVDGATITHRRCQSAGLTLDEVLIQGRANIEMACGDCVLVIQPRAGSLAVTGGSPHAVDNPLLVAHGTSCVLDVNTARFHVVSVATDVLRKVAADRHLPLPRRIQFLNTRPRSPGAVRAWHRALDYVTATFASADTARQPLTVASAATLLAAMLLECYPSNVTAEQDLLSDPRVPEPLKDAVSFIHTHVGRDIGISDVSAAVHLTPRAVQYLFRQQLDTTPTEYVRRVRLHRAHQELIVADRSAVTVTEIAHRWGFIHTGRFSVLYRQTYGQSPHTTLRL